MEDFDQTLFCLTFFATQTLGIILVILTGYWRGVFHDGFGWQGDALKQFNWHPFLLTIGLVFLYGNGMLIYRVFRNAPKKVLKIFHASIMLTSFIFMVIALKAVFDSNNYNEDKNGKPDPLPHMKTLHSWMGIMTATLFTMQWVTGYVMFLAPIAISSWIKSFYLSIHNWFGLFIFILACSTVLLGVAEENIYKGFDMRNGPEGYMMNITSLLVIVFCGLVIFLSLNVKYKRLPLPEESYQKISEPKLDACQTSDQIKIDKPSGEEK